ncbi:Uncharacterised protein [Chlamydia trachomatis]|nr:Uncharacterised protein [Chlamydia trachomatis]
MAKRTKSKAPSKAPPMKIEPKAADVMRISMFTVLSRISSKDLMRAGVPAKKKVRMRSKEERA